MRKWLTMSLGMGLLLLAGLASAVDVQPADKVASAVANTEDFSHVVWRGVPIAISLPIGSERMVKFDEPVRLENHNPLLTTDKLQVQNNAGFLYFTAKAQFSPIRLAVVLTKSKQVVLLDIAGVNTGSAVPVEVVLPASPARASGNPAAAKAVTEIGLLRYAVQTLYAPKRLMPTDTRIHRTPMMTTRSIRLFRTETVLALPLASWRGGRHYVTAVLVKNLTETPVILSPQWLTGHFSAVSFYPARTLAPAKTEGDRTTVFLLSDAPFHRALHQIQGGA